MPPLSKPQCPVCSPLSTSTAEELFRSAVPRSFAKDALIHSQGDRSDGFYVVLSGKVKLFKVSPAGREVVVATVGPGSAFAEHTILGDGLHTENAVAIEPVEGLFVPKKEVMNLLARDPALSRSLAEAVSQWVRTFSTLVEKLQLSSAEERFASFLSQAIETQKTSTIRLTVKKRELAAQLGMRPETLSRLIAELTKAGIIETGPHGSIRILKQEALKSTR